MRILIVHNFYQQAGGEDTVVARESALLKNAGHAVISYYRSNDEVNRWGRLHKALIPVRMIWARDAIRDLEAIIVRKQPDIVHFHNTHFMISPAAYNACRKNNIPVIQSLYNPRLMCPAASFCRNGSVCEECSGKISPWPGILHACYRESRGQTAAVAAMLTFHRLRKTWSRYVNYYIVATEFYRQKYELGGLPSDKLVIKPHFVDPDPLPRETPLGDYALYVGRLSPEKGVATMLSAWESVGRIPLKIRGDGILVNHARLTSERLPTVELVGRLSEENLHKLIKGARFLIWPSEGLYETFGLIAIEAFACGVPVIASRTGVMQEIVADTRTGLHFRAGDAHDLAEKVKWAYEHPEQMAEMGRNARLEFESKYTAERNYPMLMDIYMRAISGTNRA